MERYTYFDGGKWRLKIGDTEYSGDWVERLAAYEETGLEPEAVEHLKLASMGKAIAEIKEFEGVPIDRLRELAQAKKKGRLVVLPCDVGDKLYDVTLAEVREKIVVSLSMFVPESVNHLVIHAENFRNAVTSYELQDIGKTVFLTREAAEGGLSTLDDEHRALVLALENREALGLDGIVLRWQEEILGFTLGALLTENVFDVHFERARGDIQGAYPAVNRSFARYIREKYPQVRYLDREDDMGLPGLRKAKESYYPDYLEVNFSAVEIRCDLTSRPKTEG